MEHGEPFFYSVVLAVSFLLFVASVTTVFIKRLRAPYTVVLVVIGLALSVFSEYETFAFLNVLELSPDLVFYLFLPMLIFEGAYNIRYLDLRSSIKTISLLSVISLSISTFFIGFVLYFILPYAGIQVSLLTLLLFGALISATDPIAALTIFKEIGVPKRLRMLLEGESLLNDGTALALFQVILVMMAAGAFTGRVVVEGFAYFWVLLLGGAVFGIVMGWLFAKLIEKVRNIAVVEITLTLILAHITFIFAERFLSVSGIIATTAAAMMIGNYGRYKISPNVREFMEHFWEYAAFVSNSLIFLLIGLSVKGASFGEYILPVLMALGVVLVARFLSVFTVAPIVNRFFTREGKIPFSWQLVLAWGGLRGALPLAIVLLLPADFAQRNFILVLTLATIFFTLVIKAATMKSFLHYLKLHLFSSTEELEREEGFILMDGKIQSQLRIMVENKRIPQNAYDKLSGMYHELNQKSKEHLRELFEKKGDEWSYEKMLSMLRKHALGMEKLVYLHLFERNALNEAALAMLHGQIERQVNRIERDLPQIREKEKLPLTQYIQDFFLKKLKRVKITTVQKWHDDMRAREVVQDYCVHRARREGSEEVEKELEGLQKESDSVLFNEALSAVIAQYRKWHVYNSRQMDLIKQARPQLVEKVEYTIANLISLNMEMEILKDMRAKGIIAENVFADVYQYYDRLHLEKEHALIHYHEKRLQDATSR
ncbi:MAG: sodium:proton antiporter [Candidatus Azambacteria bacterium]|nr:sodium:proton antiporter [Candidatus Azambacteria bacterium]